MTWDLFVNTKQNAQYPYTIIWKIVSGWTIHGETWKLGAFTIFAPNWIYNMYLSIIKIYYLFIYTKQISTKNKNIFSLFLKSKFIGKRRTESANLMWRPHCTRSVKGWFKLDLNEKYISITVYKSIFTCSYNHDFIHRLIFIINLQALKKKYKRRI